MRYLNERQAGDALRKLMEAVVLRFRFDQSSGEFLLTTDYPDQLRNSVRAFIELRFSGVDLFAREQGDQAKYHRFWGDFHASSIQEPIVVQHVTLSDSKGGRRVEFWMGPSFGGFSFLFDGVTGRVRDSRVDQKGGVFAYFDLKTREPFDFFDPFAA